MRLRAGIAVGHVERLRIAAHREFRGVRCRVIGAAHQQGLSVGCVGGAFVREHRAAQEDRSAGEQGAS